MQGQRLLLIFALSLLMIVEMRQPAMVLLHHKLANPS